MQKCFLKSWQWELEERGKPPSSCQRHLGTVEVGFSLSQLDPKSACHSTCGALSVEQHIGFSRKPFFLQSLFNSILLDLPFQAQPQRLPSALTIETVS